MIRFNDNIEYLKLTEQATTRFSDESISPESGKYLWQEFDKKRGVLQITFPSIQTENQWEITARDWIGVIPLSNSQQLLLQSKTPIRNFFGMWEYAYDLRSINFLEGSTKVESLLDFFDNLAKGLANWVIKRGHIGFHRRYLAQIDELPFVRGRILTKQNPTISSHKINCEFDTLTTNIPDNQILLYTLQQIAKMGLCKPFTQQMVRKAYHLLIGSVSLRPFSPQDCINRTYTRLNQDYQPMHALCRFFLEHTGPSYETGNHEIRPFLINMPRLFEQFVANWLKKHLTLPWQLQIQESVHIGTKNEFRFDIDLVLYDENGRSWGVLDTKYKTPIKPDSADVHQIIAYAKAKQATNAILIYPTPLESPLDIQLDDINIRTLSFSLEGDMQKSGEFLLNALHKTKAGS